MTPHARQRRIATVGAATLLIAVGLGAAIERGRFGSTDRAAFARVEADIRDRVGRIVATLRSKSASLARPELVVAGNRSSVRALMDATASTIDAGGGGIVAATVFNDNHLPLAWSGRPSELPGERIAGPEGLFVTPGPLGPRMVHIRPVVIAGQARRVGTIATEWALTGNGGPQTVETVRFDSLVSVMLRPRYPGAGAATTASTFVIHGPDGDPLLEGAVSAADLARARADWRRGVRNVALTVVAVTLVLLAGPLLDRRRSVRSTTRYVGLVATVLALLVLARTALWWALTGPWAQPELAGIHPAFSPLRVFARSAFDLFLTALCGLCLVVVVADVLDRWRLMPGRRRLDWNWSSRAVIPFVAAHLAAGTLVAVLISRYGALLTDALSSTPLDLLRFSLYPWNLQRLAFTGGLVGLHAVVVWTGVLVLRALVLGWRIPARALKANLVLAGAWMTGLVLVLALQTGRPAGPLVWPVATTMGLALTIGTGRVRYRHASQGLRLVLGGLALIVPALAMYPATVTIATRGTRQLIEEQFGPDALTQREQIQDRVRRSRDQINALLAVQDDLAQAGGLPSSRAAYLIWSNTDLARTLATSSVEIYGPTGSLVSRFAFNLPEENAGVLPDEWTPQTCEWETYEEVSPIGAEERRIVFAGRGLCRSDGRAAVGAVVVRAMVDYDALSFIATRRLPYELLRLNQARDQDLATGRNVEFAIYGWSRRPTYTSTGSAWALDESVFARLAVSRERFWVTATDGAQDYDVFLLSDRAGVYALGYAHLTRLGHVINLAELAVLASLLYLLWLAGLTAFSVTSGLAPGSRRAFLREIRTSFYRKLFLAFVLASVVPVATLYVVTRAFIAAQARSALEAEAVRAASAAQRVVEDYSTLLERDEVDANVDDLMVGISRAIDQDVNVFSGPSLQATSERFLFESRLLPERTPSGVYRAIAIERRSSFVDEERAGDFSYMVAATPVRLGSRDAMLTIPFSLRQQETLREVDALDRRILLAAVMFILLGAAIGYSMAERIADPVSRLTRATRRIARGDLDVRVLGTSSDELRTLIEAFNRMAAELRQQRGELERTNRIAAWAEMARQVAHEIKNPLTPIQLSAEHLLRLHRDRGRPLTPVLEECVTVILSQVKLLRQIASEFSAFASSPTPHPAPTSLAELIHEVVTPYRTGLSGRIEILVDVSSGLPPVNLDRALIARTLTNVIENAIHAMPRGGTVAITAAPVDGQARLEIADTGEGMDADALEHAFEPYFSTKTGGTGLGLPIAKRTVELHGGTIAVESRKGEGTTVTIGLPIS